MIKQTICLAMLVSVFGCITSSAVKSTILILSEEKATLNEDFTMIFASCNDQDRPQPLWNPILQNSPDVFIWGGDNIYADTDDMQKMANDYNKVLANEDYRYLAKNTTIIGTWDDHDYGKNDAGADWKMKDSAQQLFLDFINFPKDDTLREQKGIYYSQIYKKPKGSIKVILLDTRYFRDSLHKSNVKGWRYDAWKDGKERTVLGETQWKWLQDELKDDTHDFTVIVSSIQFLTDEHGWEKWGNFPSEVSKMKNLLANAKAENILFMSGDRHLAEFSSTKVVGLDYPLIDFTTSGLTHTFPDGLTSPNRYRVGEVIKDLNFGVLRFDFKAKKIAMEIRGEGNKLFGTLLQQY